MDRLRELERARDWLVAMRPLPSDVLEELRHRYEVRFTYHSTAIEGNTLTQSETQIVLEKGVTIGGKPLRDHLEAIGHKEALDFVTDLAHGNEPLGERQIREIHSLVMKGQDGGAYRQLDVKAAGTDFIYPSWMHIGPHMAEFAQWIEEPHDLTPIEFATETHLRFVTIHPFRDGNGRVGRLLMNLLLIRSGYPIAVIPVERRVEYIDALSKAQTHGSINQLLHLVMDAVEASLRDSLATCMTSASLSISRDIRESVRAWLNPD